MTRESKGGLDASQIDRFIQEKLPDAMVGVLLQDPKTGKILYQYNANKTFTPASGLKIFTSAVAIQALGQEYQFNTRIHSEASRPHQNSEPQQVKNLYIEFSGDPSLTSADLKTLIIAAIKKHQIRKISEAVILDTTAFQAPHYPFGWSWEDLAWCFAAPVTSVILNENSVQLKIVSNPELGEKASIYFAENTENNPEENSNKNYTTLKSTVVSVTKEMAETECSIQVAMDQKNSAVLSGCWPEHPEPDTVSLAIQNPTFVAETLLRETLTELNVEWSNKVILGKTPESVSLLAEHSSKPLKALLQPVLENSNNLYAESVFKTLGLKKRGQGTFLSGIQATQDMLRDEFGLKINECKIADGSGNSRYNKITPFQMSIVLDKIYHSKTLYPIFQDFLPKWGQSGTLKNRNKDGILATTVHAKTGYMTGIATLSGYLTLNPDQTLIFVVMINNTLEKYSKVQEFQERLLLQLLEPYQDTKLKPLKGPLNAF